MRRQYYRGSRLVEVEQLDEVVAVLVAEGSRERLERDALGASAELRLREAGVDEETVELFARARWLFVDPSGSMRDALETGEEIPDVLSVGKIIKRRGDRIGVATDLLNVRLDPALSRVQAEAELQSEGLEIVAKLNFADNLYEVRATSSVDSLAASLALHENPRFIFAEPSFIECIPQRFSPADPRYADQWQWNNTGASGGTTGADVDAEKAWDHTFGAGIRVAVIDNGFQADHEDLAAGVGPMSGYFSNTVMGVTFNQGTAGMPDSDHGTFCAGMAGARRGNGVGGVGAAPDCDLMLVGCLGDQVGTQTTLARAVAYAANPATELPAASPADGADILVSSLGPNGAEWDLTLTLELALEGAAANGREGRGLAIFWAASNGRNVNVMLDEVVSHPDVIAVVRSNRNDLEDNAARGPEVELIAPGVDVFSTDSGNSYRTWTGTSFAAPCAAGCAALALSMAPDLTRDELRDVMRRSADQVGGVAYDAAGHNDDYGFGRVNAYKAVVLAVREVQLLTPSVVFNDVPEGETTARAVVWEVAGVEDLTFEVVSGPVVLSGPAGSFSTLLGTSLTVPAPGAGAVGHARMWLVHTGGAIGSSATGEVVVRCVQTGERWTVSLSGNTIARPTAAVVMVLDKSGSMDWDAGDGRTRVEVLRESAQALVDVLRPDTGVGVVSFDQDASVVMDVVGAGPEIFGPGRARATAAVAGHTPNPAGATSIGDGVEAAGLLLDAVTGSYDKTAMVVLTDGQENAPKLIADVAGSIDDTVFAIGLGTPAAINPEKLTSLTNGTGGYMTMTGVLSSDERFLLAKYYLQILAGVTNEQVVLDPGGNLPAGGKTTVPFTLNRADSSADVILLSPAPHVLKFSLETPSGQIITPAVPSGVSYVTGRNVAYYRFNLPVVGITGKEQWSGKWLARLVCDKAAFIDYLKQLEERNPREHKYASTHGLQYSLEIHGRSSLVLTASLSQSGITPGSIMHLTARLTEFGLPIDEDRAAVRAELTGPTGPRLLTLDPRSNGTYTTEITGTDHGLYRFRILANGKTLRLERFTREHTLTGTIYTPRGPEDPKPDVESNPPRLGQLRNSFAPSSLMAAIQNDPQLANTLDASLRQHQASLPELLAYLEQESARPSKGSE
ncbi:S8 family serine peptidase [Streptomyces sp. NPDC050504]|uniref:S8 family serine peptidase n=1 Tax=Streptomyces sp. NPDC050504 TaxID=3365618 RepID=UPI0037BA8191